MSKQEGYLRWLGRLLSKIPGGLKNIVTGIPKFLGSPRTEAYVGWYGMIGGVIFILGTLWLNRPSEYVELFGKSYVFGLRNPQWGLIVLVGFFLLTHGIYRLEKEAED